MNILSNIINISWIIPGVSQILLFIDGLLFAVLDGVIGLVFLIGNFDLSTISEAAENLVSNIKSLVGIYILFKASLLFIQYLIEPDAFKDKAKGGEAFIKNVMVVIILLTLLSSNLLFGIFNDIQKVIFSYGTTENPVKYEVLDKIGIVPNTEKTDMIQRIVWGSSKIDNPGHFLTVKIAEQFLFVCEMNDIDASNCNRDWFSYPKPTDSFWTALSSAVDPAVMLGSIAHSGVGIAFFGLATVGTGLQALANVQYIAIISTVFAIYMIMKFMKITMQLVMRFFKLFLMQILSPIAIVSYATPDGKKTFQNFWKTYFTIYFELFLRLFVVYVSIYIMSIILGNSNLIVGKLDFITEMILKLILLIGIAKFMDEMPELVASFFGTKLGDPKQKSMGNILGGIIGGGIGAGIGLGAAKAAGVHGFGALANAGMGLFGGAKSGSSAQNMGAFVSGQVSNATKSVGRGRDIFNSDGIGNYLQMQADKTLGTGNSLIRKGDVLKSQADHDKQSFSNLEAVKSAAERRYLKEELGVDSDRGSYINTKVGEYDKRIDRYNKGEIKSFQVHELDDKNEFKKDQQGNYVWKEGGIEDLMHEREVVKTQYGDKFDEEVSEYMNKKIAKGEDSMHPLLKQAYQNYNDYEDNYAKTHPNYTPVRLKSGTVIEDGKEKFKHTFKYSKDTASDVAHASQKEYAEHVSSQRYQNISRK